MHYLRLLRYQKLELHMQWHIHGSKKVDVHPPTSYIFIASFLVFLPKAFYTRTIPTPVSIQPCLDCPSDIQAIPQENRLAGAHIRSNHLMETSPDRPLLQSGRE